MNIAVLGLGIIGSRASSHLRRHPDHEVTLWNRTTKGLEGEVDELGDAVREAEVIALYLQDSQALREVMAQVFEHALGQPVILNHSTVDLETTLGLANDCAQRSWGFLDAPFTGSRDAAAAGALVYYCAGDRSHQLLLAETRIVTNTDDVGEQRDQ